MAYVITGRKCGTVRFEPSRNGVVKTESVSLSSKVTSNPVEDGADINDHVVKDPIKFSIAGTVIGGQSAADKLQSMWDKRDILTFTGRVRIESIVLTSVTFDYSAKNETGCEFKASFQTVNIASSRYLPMGETPLMSQQDGIKGVQSEGLKTVISESISSSAYAAYVDSYKGKPASSAGPATRQTPSYNGVK